MLKGRDRLWLIMYQDKSFNGLESLNSESPPDDGCESEGRRVVGEGDHTSIDAPRELSQSRSQEPE